MDLSLGLVAAVILSLVGLKLLRSKNRLRKLPLPPGPKGWPIIGNVQDLLVKEGAEHPWIRYAKWSETFGDLVYLEIFGQRFLVLNSVKATTELLEKRSANYSDRAGMLKCISVFQMKLMALNLRNAYVYQVSVFSRSYGRLWWQLW